MISIIKNHAPIKTAAWNFIGFDDVNPDTTPGVVATIAYAADLIKGIWVEFPNTATEDIAGRIVMVSDKGNDTVEILVMSDGDEPTAYILPDDAPVTVYTGPEGYATGYAGKYLA
jgi:hypothetical protein